jgi:hypothetical protein
MSALKSAGPAAVTPSFARRRAVRAAGIAAVAFFLMLVARFWHPTYGFTSFIQLDTGSAERMIPALRDLPIYTYPEQGGYDGVYYAQIACDPTLRNPEFVPALDNFSYRARRILPSALAWMFGAGQPRWIVQIYPLINVAAWLALAWLLWRLLDVDDWREWLAWFGVMFSAGALFSVRLALTDLASLAIMAGAFHAIEAGRHSLASNLLAAAALARETALAAFAGFARRPWLSSQNVLRALAVAAPLAVWLAYVRMRAGVIDQGWGNFTLPVAGLVEKWRAALVSLRTVNDQTLAWTTLLATAGLTVQGAFILTRWRPDDRWWRVGAAFAALMLCLGTVVWEGYPGAATRAVLPLTLAFNIVACHTRASLAWLLAGNLTVFSGLLALRDVPHEWRDFTSVHANDTTVVARLDAGWFGIEESRRSRWAWAEARGKIILTARTARAQSIRLTCMVHSLAPRTVVVRQGDRELARLAAGHKPVPCDLVVQLGDDGRGEVEFATDTPGVRESPNADARSLAFAVYDPRLAPASP